MPTNRNKQPQANNSSGPLTSSSGNELLFQFLPEQDIHVEMIAGEPWFLAKDVSDILGYSRTEKAIQILDEDERLIHLTGVSGQVRKSTFINESGLYHLIFFSTKDAAKAFRKWVTTEVLPSIRKYGAYCSGLEGIDSCMHHGVKFYRYSDVLTLLGKRSGGSSYQPSKKWTSQFVDFGDGIFASEQYVLILLQRKSIKGLFEPIKAAQQVIDAQQLSLFNDTTNGGDHA